MSGITLTEIMIVLAGVVLLISVAAFAAIGVIAVMMPHRWSRLYRKVVQRLRAWRSAPDLEKRRTRI